MNTVLRNILSQKVMRQRRRGLQVAGAAGLRGGSLYEDVVPSAGLECPAVGGRGPAVPQARLHIAASQILAAGTRARPIRQSRRLLLR